MCAGNVVERTPVANEVGKQAAVKEMEVVVEGTHTAVVVGERTHASAVVEVGTHAEGDQGQEARGNTYPWPGRASKS